MSDAALNPFKNERYKRLKSLEWLLYGVSVVAWTVFGAAMWNPGEYWGRSSRHSLVVGSWLVFAVLGLCRLILMRRRSQTSSLPSPSVLSTLDLSERPPNSAVSSEHWRGE